MKNPEPEVIEIKYSDKGSVRVYVYKDDLSRMFISGLSVVKKARKKGVGTLLIQMCEDLAKRMDIMDVGLLVNRTTWQYDWYERLGYKAFKLSDRPDHIWMIKALVK